MKNTNKVSKIPVLGFAVIAAIAFTLALTACDIFNNDDNGDGTGKVTISGTPKIGEKITAKTSGEFLSGPRWQASANGVDEWMTLDDFVNQKEITIPSGYYDYSSPTNYSNMEGRFIRAWIYLNYSYDSAVYSNVIGPVQR